MTKKTSMKNIEIILSIRELQKMISDTESQEVIKVLKEARNALIKIYADNKEELKQYQNQYNNQICCYNNEVLTLATLSMRFIKAGIPHPVKEAKKYLIGGNDD